MNHEIRRSSLLYFKEKFVLATKQNLNMQDINTTRSKFWGFRQSQFLITYLQYNNIGIDFMFWVSTQKHFCCIVQWSIKSKIIPFLYVLMANNQELIPFSNIFFLRTKIINCCGKPINKLLNIRITSNKFRIAFATS